MIDTQNMADGRDLFRAETLEEKIAAQVFCPCGDLLIVGFENQASGKESTKPIRCKGCGRSWECSLVLVIREHK